MTKTIKRVEDLPKSFSLEKYADVAGFDIGKWVPNLEARTYTRFLLGNGRLKRLYHPEYRKEAMTRTTYWLANPMAPSRSLDGPGVYKNVDSSHVTDLTVVDYLYSGQETMIDADRPGYKKFLDAFKEFEAHPSMAPDEVLAQIMSTPVWKMHREAGIDDEDTVTINVDLHGSEEKIVSDFIAWLRRTRQTIGIVAPKKRFSRQDFIEWTNFAILPYLDLTCWADAHEIEITQQVLGIALFPNDFNVNLAERIRKVVRPLALTAVGEVSTNALRSQALAELAESNSDQSIPGKFDSV